MTAMMASNDSTRNLGIPSAVRRSQPLPEPTFISLIEVLFQATSPDPEAMSRAAAYLSDLETHVSLWSLLLDVAFTRSSPFDATFLAKELSTSASSTAQLDVPKRWSAIRTVAIIRFKNGVDKYWRSRVVNRVTITIPKDAKDSLRHTLLRCLDEEDRGVALQASVAISRMARYDFPNAWPNLFDELQHAMIAAHAKIVANSDVALNRLILMRSADVCARTLKELGTVRILAGRIRMTELSQQLLPTFVPMFQQYYHETLPSTSGSDQSDAQWQEWSKQPLLAQRIRTCHLLLKCVTHLAVADAGTITRNAHAEGGARINYAREMFRVTPTLLQGLFDIRNAYIAFIKTGGTAEPDESILTTLHKHLLAFGKLYAALADREKSKAPLWEGWDEVVLWYWQRAVEVSMDELADPNKGYTSSSKIDASVLQRQPTKMIVQAITLMQRSLQEWNKNGSLPDSFKSETMVSSIVDVLVGKLMLLNRDELETWQSDSEDWSVAEEAETYAIDVRPAAERALMVLSTTAPSRQSSFVAQLLWQKFEEMSGSSDTTLDAVLRRDAIYAALGRCCDRLNNEDEVLSKAVAEHFVPHASLSFSSDPTWLIIRRRIAWLIWEWSEQIDVQHRALVYELLVSLLEDVPGKTDVAVRLASARSLAALADAIEFDSDAFRPFIDASLSRLANLAAGGELHEMDSIKTCTNAMSILIERLGARISQHLEQLASLVPHLWLLDDPECKAKPSIIVFVGRLVRSVELIPHSSQGAGNALHGIVSVIVRDSLAPHHSPLLGKDALELWIRTLRSSSQMTDALFGLLDLLPGLLDLPDFCPEACRIAQESTLMAAQAVVEKYGSSLFESFAKIVGDPLSPLVLHPLTALDMIIQALHAQDVNVMSWARLLDGSGLFAMLLGSLLKVKDSANVTGFFVSLLARLAFVLNGNTIFLDLVRSAASRLECADPDVGSTVIRPMAEMWCAKVETMASSRKRKITCLGLAALLAGADAQREPQLFDVMHAMIGVWMDLMGDVREDAGAAEDANAPSMPHAPPSSPQLQRSRSLSQASEVMRHRSPSPALEIPGLEGIDDADEWLQETSPGKARLTELNRLDPVNTVKLTTFIADSLRHAQVRGGPMFATRWASIDPLVLDLLQKDLSM